MKTKTATFGVTKRESHDSSTFYSRKIYDCDLSTVFKLASEVQYSPRNVVQIQAYQKGGMIPYIAIRLKICTIFQIMRSL